MSRKKPVRARRSAALTIAAATSASGVAFVGLATADDGEPSKVAVKVDSVAFFDLDHTIIDCNSNKHWIQHEFMAGKVTPKLLALAVYWFTRYAMVGWRERKTPDTKAFCRTI